MLLKFWNVYFPFLLEELILLVYICSLLQSNLKESQYQLTPWRSDTNHANVATQSQPHSIGAPLETSVCSYRDFVPFR